MVHVVIDGEILTLPEAYLNTLDALNKWLYIEDWQSFNIILGAAAALYIPGDPLWLRIIAASGAGKTEILRAIAGHGDSFELGSLTSGSLIGGFKDGYKVLQDAHGKRVITLDISPIITKSKETRKQLFGIFRSVYDGSFVSAFGSTQGLLKQKSFFDWLLGATPAIENQRSLDAELGERFIDLRLIVRDPEKVAAKASQNTGSMNQMRAELRNAVSSLLDFCKASSQPQIHPDIADAIPKLADLMTWFRTPVPRDRYHNVPYIPQREVGTRVAQSLNRLAKGLALIRGKQVADWEEYLGLLRVAADSMPSTRRAILAAYLSGKSKIDDIAKATSFSMGQVSELLQDLELLAITKGNRLIADFDKAAVTIPGAVPWRLKADYSRAIIRR